MEVLAALALSVVGALWAVQLHRGMPPAGWRTRWSAVAPERKKRIRNAIAHGRAVDDPDDAELALEAIENGARVLETMSRPRMVATHWAFLAALILGEHSYGVGGRWLLALAGAEVAPTLAGTACLPFVRSHLRTLATARAMNEPLAVQRSKRPAAAGQNHALERT